MSEIAKSLFKKKLSNFLILFQMVIALLFFFEAYAGYQTMFKVFQSVPKMVKEETSDIILIEVNSDIEQKDFQDYFMQLRKSGMIKNFSGYKNSWIKSSALGSVPI